ncbi:MAG: DNA-directed RNA polymerase subunit beta [Lactobacillus sp.]|jgi:hypothetical protein|nr:DNA-directed RNA polymerase subunit beta [Lactobacillus sp.]MCI1481399.1 DNA-directed RNA polymerase subunit beta [Lactobacillus sp.]
MKLFNQAIVKAKVRKFFHLCGWLILMIVIGAFIGCGISSGNPFAIFFPSSWLHLFQFIS